MQDPADNLQRRDSKRRASTLQMHIQVATDTTEIYSTPPPQLPSPPIPPPPPPPYTHRPTSALPLLPAPRAQPLKHARNRAVLSRPGAPPGKVPAVLVLQPLHHPRTHTSTALAAARPSANPHTLPKHALIHSGPPPPPKIHGDPTKHCPHNAQHAAYAAAPPPRRLGALPDSADNPAVVSHSVAKPAPAATVPPAAADESYPPAEHLRLENGSRCQVWTQFIRGGQRRTARCSRVHHP
jgi:hypothetical protein